MVTETLWKQESSLPFSQFLPFFTASSFEVKFAALPRETEREKREMVVILKQMFVVEKPIFSSVLFSFKLYSYFEESNKRKRIF